MRNILLIILLVFFVSLKAQTSSDYLLVQFTELDGTFCLNSQGDTVIPPNKYANCFGDTIKTIGFVARWEGGIWAINKQDSLLFEVFNYDNGPDLIYNGLFRIIKNGLIGYANMTGEIIIMPQFKCAWPFNEAKAKVSFNCKHIKLNEITLWESEEWFYIDKDGNKIKE